MVSASLSSLLLAAFGAVAQARVQYLGMAMSGGEFGCLIDGTCPIETAQLPLLSLGGADGLGQMKHFYKSDGLTMFRLPTSWQYLINSDTTVSGTVDKGNFANYDALVKACLSTGAYCMIDVHNFARFNGGIIGQGGPSDALFVQLWTTIAKAYADESKVLFEITNEPHNLDIDIWAATCQKVVNAIRGAGATSQMILLPGTNYDSAATIVSSGSADALLAITNPDGSTDGLILDVHKYLDEDNSGTHAECVMNNVDTFDSLSSYLRTAGRVALVSETGASNSSSCFTDFCAQNTAINDNSDVLIGLVAWAAGGLDNEYLLSLTPTDVDGTYVDNALMKKCVLGPYGSSAPLATSSVESSSASSSVEPSSSVMSSSSAMPSSSSIISSIVSSSMAASSTTAMVKAAGASVTTPTATASSTATKNAAVAATGAANLRNLALGMFVGAALL